MGLLFERDDWHRDFCIDLVYLIVDKFPEMSWETGNTLSYRFQNDIGDYVDARILADRERTPDESPSPHAGTPDEEKPY